MKLIEMILSWTQPWTVLVFVISGILSLAVGKTHHGTINLLLATVNFFIFYGGRFLR